MTERVTIIEAKDRFKNGGGGGEKETMAPAFSEDAIALRFTEIHGGDLLGIAPATDNHYRRRGEPAQQRQQIPCMHRWYLLR